MLQRLPTHTSCLHHSAHRLRTALPLTTTGPPPAGAARFTAAMATGSGSSSSLHSGSTFFLDTFAMRQWDDPKYSGTRIQYDKQAFVETVHRLFQETGGRLVDGYAPFCKHVFLPNFVGAKLGALEITPDNKRLLQSGYSRRRPEELAVLTRWFPEADVQPVPDAKVLDLILYSREQLLKEHQAMPGKAAPLPDAPWGIISIKAQNEPYETPMQPITMMRNAIGVAEGGSGVALQREAYEASCEYWQSHAPIVAGESPNGE